MADRETELEFGCELKGGDDLRWLCPVFSRWSDCIKDYIKCTNGDDIPYWWNERANISLLAGAAWRQRGFIALEEYPSKREVKEEIKDCRIDLYIGNKPHDIVIEFKQGWLQPKTTDYQLRQIVSKARHSVQDRYEAEYRTGGVYWTVMIPIIYNNDDVKSIIDEQIKRIRKIKNINLLAWCFPKATRNLVDRKKDFFYPGIIAALSIVKRRSALPTVAR